MVRHARRAPAPGHDARRGTDTRAGLHRCMGGGLAPCTVAPQTTDHPTNDVSDDRPDPRTTHSVIPDSRVPVGIYVAPRATTRPPRSSTVLTGARAMSRVSGLRAPWGGPWPWCADNVRRDLTRTCGVLYRLRVRRGDRPYFVDTSRPLPAARSWGGGAWDQQAHPCRTEHGLTKIHTQEKTSRFHDS